MQRAEIHPFTPMERNSPQKLDNVVENTDIVVPKQAQPEEEELTSSCESVNPPPGLKSLPVRSDIEVRDDKVLFSPLKCRL